MALDHRNVATWLGSVGGTVAIYQGGWIWPRLKALVGMIRRKRKTVQADEARSRSALYALLIGVTVAER